MIKVVLVKTPVVHDTEPLITILYNWFGAENVVADEKNDWVSVRNKSSGLRVDLHRRR